MKPVRKATLKNCIKTLVAVVGLGALYLAPGDAAAQKMTFIRDAEIENTLRRLSEPIFAAAGLDPSSVRIHIVNDSTLNAFVTGGMNIFLHTGLLLRTESPEQLAGVIAHETGHISGGHLAKLSGALGDARARSIIGFVLGGAAAVAGRPDVGAVLAQSGAHIGQRSLLQFTRTQESAADQAAVRFLDASKISSIGLLEFLDVLGDQDLLSRSRQDAYVRTHPLTRQRIEFLTDYVKKSPFSDSRLTGKIAEGHRRMRAKLAAFLNPPSRTLRLTDKGDGSTVARYARAIAQFRQANMVPALELIEGLIKTEPNNPYFRELKGQMLFENGRGSEAIGPYEKAVDLAPDSALLRLGLAQAQLEQNDRSLIGPAIANLKTAIIIEPTSSFAWRQLGIAHGRNGQMGESALALAEEAIRLRRLRDARIQAVRAGKLLPQGSPGWLRAEDIKQSTPK